MVQIQKATDATDKNNDDMDYEQDTELDRPTYDQLLLRSKHDKKSQGGRVSTMSI